MGKIALGGVGEGLEQGIGSALKTFFGVKSQELDERKFGLEEKKFGLAEKEAERRGEERVLDKQLRIIQSRILEKQAETALIGQKIQC